MGTWGTAISSNDTYADIYGQFFDLYNDGIEVTEITNRLITSHQVIIKDPDDSNNFWFALAKAQWECKQLEQSVYSRIKSIIEDESDILLWRRLGSEQKDINKRKIVLEKFLRELSTERPKAKARRRKVIRQPVFAKGDCITFKLKNGNYGGFVVLEAIYNSEHGHNLIATTIINQPQKPVGKDFIQSFVMITDFAANTDKPLIVWFLPLRYKTIAHLFEKIDKIDVDHSYDIKGLGYGHVADLDLWVIDQANRQFEHELSTNKESNKSTSIKSLTKKNKWRLW